MSKTELITKVAVQAAIEITILEKSKTAEIGRTAKTSATGQLSQKEGKTEQEGQAWGNKHSTGQQDTNIDKLLTI